MSNQEIMKVDRKTLSQLMEGLDSHLYHALKNSIYPGAKDESIAMVLAYCKAKNYDPLQKPVHIVPMNVKDSVTQQSSWRDVIMPGIGAYRIDAHRTGVYMGLSKPVFGPVVTKNFNGQEFSYPEYCSIIVKRMVNGVVCDFESEEYWDENYASKGKDSSAPNSMWFKRKRGQIAKCAEAQALRKAFPEAVGQVPTYEEMEGREMKDIQGVVDLLEDSSSIDSAHLDILRNKILIAGSDEQGICSMMNIQKLEDMKAKEFSAVSKMLDYKSKSKPKQKPKEEFEISEHLAADMALVEREALNG